MGLETAIEWCDATFNPWRGCTKVSAGCAHCYAETQSKRNLKVLGQWGPNGTRVVAGEGKWKEIERLNRKAGNNYANWKHAVMSATSEYDAVDPYERPRVFCASMADVFEDWRGPMMHAETTAAMEHELCVCHGCGAWLSYLEGCVCGADRLPKRLTMDDVRHRLFRLIHATPNLDWLLLTKRPENVAPMLARFAERVDTYVAEAFSKVWNRRVWLGTSVENQAAADERIPHLLRTPAAVRFLSCEPLLGPVEFSNVSRRSDAVQRLGKPALDGIGWVIVGGESGHGARPCRVEWVRSLVKQCQIVGVPVFVKQLGAVVHWNGIQGGYGDGPSDVWPMSTAGFGPASGGWQVPLRNKKGGDITEFPPDLAVREFPAPAEATV